MTDNFEDPALSSPDPDEELGHALDGEVGFELVMPFVGVASKGGPHHDASYAAGWEMGILDTELELAQPPIAERLIHSTNAEQADLIAIRHGYRAEIAPTGTEGWSTLRLTKTGVD